MLVLDVAYHGLFSSCAEIRLLHDWTESDEFVGCVCGEVYSMPFSGLTGAMVGESGARVDGLHGSCNDDDHDRRLIFGFRVVGVSE